MGWSNHNRNTRLYDDATDPEPYSHGNPLPVYAVGIVDTDTVLADGADVTQGTKSDPPATTATTDPWSVVSLLKGLLKIFLDGYNFTTHTLGIAGSVTANAGTNLNTSALATSAQIGEVQATPTANTVLDRLKAIATALASVAVTGTFWQTEQPTRRATLSNASSAGTAITTATNTQIVAAPAASHHLRVYRLWAQNSSATGSWCYWGNGSGVKTIPFFLAQNQPMMMNLAGSWDLSSATGLYINTATAAANIEWWAEYETVVD